MPYKGEPNGLKLKHLTPRAKLALKALILGAASTNKEAAKIAGLHPAYVGQIKNSVIGAGFAAAYEEKVDEKAMETSELIDLLGREALNKMGGLMRFSADENIILRASQDLMDRSPQTMKVHKAQIESFTLDGKDVKELASAMIESARLRAQFNEAATGDFVKIDDQKQISSGEVSNA